MKRIISVTLLLMMLLAFTACDQTETPTQIPSQTATENSAQTLVATETPTLEITQETATAPAVTATATPTIEITQAPTFTVTPALEITKKPTATNNPGSGAAATKDPNWQPATFPPEITKADYDFGITYIIDDFYGIFDPDIVEDYVKTWANNDGDPSELEAAVQAIQNMDFRFSEDYDPDRGLDYKGNANAVKEVKQRVKETIKDYKVYLLRVDVVPYTIYSYYSGYSGPGSIYLIAGDKAAIITVDRIIYGCDPVF